MTEGCDGVTWPCAAQAKAQGLQADAGEERAEQGGRGWGRGGGRSGGEELQHRLHEMLTFSELNERAQRDGTWIGFLDGDWSPLERKGVRGGPQRHWQL